jgi:hypothetical protein
MNGIRSLLLILTSALVLTGCSGKPSENDVKKILESEIQSQSKGLIKLTTFQKTNGAMKKVPMTGEKFYEMDFTYEITFTDDCMWDRRAMAVLGGSGGRFSAAPVPNDSKVKGDYGWKRDGKMLPPEMAEGIANAYGFSKAGYKGKTLGFNSSMSLSKTEKGWAEE